MVAAAISVFILIAYKLSTAFRKRTERIPWRSVIVKGKVLVIFFQIALMIPNTYGIPYPSIYLGTNRARIFMLHRFIFITNRLARRVPVLERQRMWRA